MANVFYNTSKKEIFDGTFNIKTDANIKMMLVSTATVYTPDEDDDVVDAGGANDAADAESVVTGYVGGHGGAGRKTLSGRDIVVNKTPTPGRAEFDFDDIVYGALGNGANQTIEASILIREGAVNDTTSRLIGYYDFANFPTNGAAFTLQVDPTGAIHLTSMFGALQLLGYYVKRLWSVFSEQLSYQQVASLNSIGIKPHIYRSIQPLRFNLKQWPVN
jgi:hypothetical protein